MHTIPCTIDILSDTNETCWLITIASKDAAGAALLFSGLHLGLVPDIRFRDTHAKDSFTIHTDTAAIGSRTVSITPTWLEALWHLFLNTSLNGWTDTAHIDQTFSSENGFVSITIAIEP